MFSSQIDTKKAACQTKPCSDAGRILNLKNMKMQACVKNHSN